MARKTILIVDDEQSTRRLVRLILTKAGYDVIEAEDGAAAIDLLEHGGYDDTLLAVVCDLEMPRMDGAQTIETFRRQFPALPVLVLTGNSDMSLAVALIKKGVSDYLLKPFDPKMLTAALYRIMCDRTRLSQSMTRGFAAELLQAAKS